MARPAANLRLFVAIYPPVEIARAMLHELDQLQLPPHRMTPIEQLHMTVQFIGDTPAAEMDATTESVQRAAAGLDSFSLRPAKLIRLPERGPTRLIAAETDSHPTLLEIHRRLVTRLAHHPRERKSDRFRPHFTLCRFRAPVHRLAIERALDIPSFAVNRIILMRSTLAASGATHHEVASCPLGRESNAH